MYRPTFRLKAQAPLRYTLHYLVNYTQFDKRFKP